MSGGAGAGTAIGNIATDGHHPDTQHPASPNTAHESPHPGQQRVGGRPVDEGGGLVNWGGKSRGMGDEEEMSIITAALSGLILVNSLSDSQRGGDTLYYCTLHWLLYVVSDTVPL